MGDELSVLNLADDFKKALGVPEASRWKLDMPAPLEVHVTVHSEKEPSQAFQARFLWTEYPGTPPSLKFRDPATGTIDVPSAWPKVRGFRPQTLDACVNWCLEGFGLHPEWRSDPRLRWDSKGNVLLKVLRILQEEMDFYYEGRF